MFNNIICYIPFKNLSKLLRETNATSPFPYIKHLRDPYSPLYLFPSHISFNFDFLFLGKSGTQLGPKKSSIANSYGHLFNKLLLWSVSITEFHATPSNLGKQAFAPSKSSKVSILDCFRTTASVKYLSLS